ncbi:MAG: hypothetical protein JXR49_12295 [Acidobacteria bacterium]|nr:hypothetical protein [Acidobacteriota bacterium]
MKPILIALLPIFIAISYSCNSTAVDESTVMREEADVYAVYVNKYYITQPWAEFKNKPFDTIVIMEETPALPSSYAQNISGLSIKPDEDTVKSFLKRNSPAMSESEENQIFIGRYPVNPSINFNLSHKLISIEELNRIYNAGSFREFYRKYPSSRGLVRLSRVGINHDMDQALFYFAQEYSEGGGEGFLILLEKKDREWGMVSRYAVWVS